MDIDTPLIDSLPLRLDDGRALIGFEIGPAGDTAFQPMIASARTVAIFLETVRRMPRMPSGEPIQWWPVYQHLPGNPPMPEPDPAAP